MMSTRREFLQSTGALVVCFAVPGCDVDIGEQPGGHALLSNRLRIDAGGSVTLSMGKVELGQGIGTALAQVAADELGVDIQRIELLDVDTDHSPDESYTFSSISVQQSGSAVRAAAAAGRRYLMRQAAREVGVDVEQLDVVDGKVLVGGESTGIDYWQLLAGQAVDVIPTDDDAPIPVSAHRQIGKSIPRRDLPGKIFGDAVFLQDLRMPGMVHARVVRPPAERATLVEFDDHAVAGMPGVLKVVRDGSFVAVIAEREQQARNAAMSLRKSLGWSLPEDLPDASRIHEWLQAARQRTEHIVEGDPGADRGSGKMVRASYQRPYQAHASISPSAAIALFENDELAIWSHAQGMYPLRTAIAHTLGMPVERVRCIYRQAAGCFGHNGADDAACDAAAIAVQFPGKPVRLQWERADEFAWEPYGSAMHIEVVADLDENDRIKRWNFDIWSCPHATRPRDVENAGNLIYAQHRGEPLEIPPARSIPQPSGGADRNGIPLYAFGNTTVNKHLVMDMPLRVSALRGLGAYGNVFAIESFMDELALVVGQDPLQFRIDHLEDDRAVDLLQMLGEVSGWAGRPAPGGDDGWGIGFARFKNMAAYVGVVMKLSVDSDNGMIRLHRATAICDAGLVINPDGVRAQIEGGIVQSASWTLKEQVRFSRSGIESRDWSSYPILRFDEVPDVDVHLLERRDGPSLGVGEAAQGPTAAAIANAVYHVSGQRLRRLPLTLAPSESAA